MANEKRLRREQQKTSLDCISVQSDQGPVYQHALECDNPVWNI